MGSIVPSGRLAWGMQLPIQMHSKTIREDWELTASVTDLVEIARTADAAGALFVAATDHVALPLKNTRRTLTPTC